MDILGLIYYQTDNDAPKSNSQLKQEHTVHHLNQTSTSIHDPNNYLPQHLTTNSSPKVPK